MKASSKPAFNTVVVVDDEESPIIEGTEVTKENFMEWKLKFDVELDELWRIEDERELDEEKTMRLTGKQYFERHAGSAAFLAALRAQEEEDDEVLVDSTDDKKELYQINDDLYADEDLPSDED